MKRLVRSSFPLFAIPVPYPTVLSIGKSLELVLNRSRLSLSALASCCCYYRLLLSLPALFSWVIHTHTHSYFLDYFVGLSVCLCSGAKYQPISEAAARTTAAVVRR